MSASQWSDLMSTLVSIDESGIDGNRDTHIRAAPPTFDDRKNARRYAVRISLAALPQEKELVDDDFDARDIPVSELDGFSKIGSADIRRKRASTDAQNDPKPK